MQLSRQPSIPPKVAPKPPRPSSYLADVHVVQDTAGPDTVRQSFEPPPPYTYVISDAAGSQTIRESFEPPTPPLPHHVNDDTGRDRDTESLVSLDQQYDHVQEAHRPPPPPVPERTGPSRLMLRQSLAAPRRPASVSHATLKPGFHYPS